MLPRWLSSKGDMGSIPGQEDPLEKEMATHSSILDWEIPWTEEPHGLQSIGLQSRTQLTSSRKVLAATGNFALKSPY